MINKAIILAAGMGTRLKPLTLSNHKCLTKVNGTPILFNALENLRHAGVDETLLVVGYLSDAIKEAVGENYNGMKISYAENLVYDRTNTSYSLLLGLQNLGEYDSLLLLEGDVFFERSLMDRLLMDSHDNMTVLEGYRPDLDGSFAERDRDGYVIDWTHKSMREAGYTLENKYKTVNIHRFGKAFVETNLYPELERSCSEKQGKEPIENVMRSIVRNDNKAVYGLLTGICRWYEIDDLKDLAEAERIFKEAQNEGDKRNLGKKISKVYRSIPQH